VAFLLPAISLYNVMQSQCKNTRGVEMQYRCPKCQSPKIMPISNGNTVAKPVVPKSLVILIPALFVLLLLVVLSIGLWIFSDGAGSTIQIATVVAFVVCVGAGIMFWRDLPDFKISMQSFMNANKDWKCRECHHEWHVQ
jgi:Zn finger protein HypA/HybF involved in hydrogenase expression